MARLRCARRRRPHGHDRTHGNRYTAASSTRPPCKSGCPEPTAWWKDLQRVALRDGDRRGCEEPSRAAGVRAVRAHGTPANTIVALPATAQIAWLNPLSYTRASDHRGDPGGRLALLTADQLKGLARHGAQARINEPQQEIAAIERAFPDLRSKRRGRPPGSRQGRQPVLMALRILPASSAGGTGGRRQHAKRQRRE